MEYYKILFKELNNKGIHYSVLRNWETLPETSGGHDIDIWVRKADFKEFVKVLHNVAMLNNSALVSYISGKDCPRYLYLAREWGIQYDVHIEIAQYRNAVYANGDLIDEHTFLHNGVKVLEPGIDSFISFLKEVLNNGICKKKYCEKATEVVINSTSEELDLYLNSFSPFVRSSIIDALTSEDYSGLKLKQVRKQCVRDISTINTKVSYYWQRLIRILGVFKKTRPGYVILVMGTDGSGKSTVIDAITPWLSEAFHHSVSYRHLRPTVIPDLGVLLGKRKNEQGKVVTNPHAHKQSGTVGSLVKWGYYLIDYTFGYLKLVWPQVSFKTKLFIFDRYYYDYYIDQKRMGVSLPKWLICIGELFVPTPDLIICLGGNPQKIYERKPETSLEEVTRQVDALKSFCSKRKNVAWIDTTTSIEETISSTKDAILKKMSSRYI